MNRLQFLHSDLTFNSFDEIKTYHDKWVYKNGSKYAEPFVFKYKDEDGEHIVLAIGKNNSSLSGDAEYIDVHAIEKALAAVSAQGAEQEELLNGISSSLGKLKSYVGAPDDYKLNPTNEIIQGSSDLTDCIFKLADYAKRLKDELSVSVTSSKSINLGLNTEKGQNITAELKLPTKAYAKGQELSNDLMLSDDGLFFNIDLNYDALNSELSLSKNGSVKKISLPKEEYLVGGTYDRESESLQLALKSGNVISVNLKDLINEWKTKDSKSIILTKERVKYDDDEYAFQDILSGEVRIHSNAHGLNNILQVDEGGLYVDGKASNIVYIGKNGEISNVQDALNNIKADLSQEDGNILVMKADGMYASTHLSYDRKSNSLILENGVNTNVVQLPSFTPITEATYNVNNETLRLVLKYNDGTDTHLDIPLSEIWNEIAVDNKSTAVILSLSEQIPGKRTLHATLQISENPNNLIKNENGFLFASNQAKDINSSIFGNVDNALIELYNKISSTSPFADEIAKIKKSVSDLTEKVDKNRHDIDCNIDEITLHKQRLNKQYNTLLTLRNDLDALKDKVSTLPTDISTIYATKSDVNDKFSTLDELKANKSDLSSLALKVSIDEQSVKDLKNTVSKDHDTVTEIQAANEKYKQDICELKDTISEINKSLTTLSATLATAQNEINELEDKSYTHATKDELNALSNRVESISSSTTLSLKNIQSQIDLLPKSLSNCATKEDVNELQKQLNALSAEVSRLKEFKEGINDTINSYILRNLQIVKDTSNTTKTTYKLKLGGNQLGDTIEVPISEGSMTIITNVELSDDGRFIIITWSNGIKTKIDLKDLIDVYTAGDGLSLTGNRFDVIIDDGEDFLTVSKNGLRLRGIKENFKRINDLAQSAYTLARQNEDKINDILNAPGFGSFCDIIDYINEIKKALELHIVNCDNKIDNVQKDLTVSVSTINNRISNEVLNLNNTITTTNNNLSNKIDAEKQNVLNVIHQQDDDLRALIDTKEDAFELIDREGGSLHLEKALDKQGKKIITGEVMISSRTDSNLKRDDGGCLYVPNSSNSIEYRNKPLDDTLNYFGTTIEELKKGSEIKQIVVSQDEGNKIVSGTDGGAFFDGNLDYGTFKL